jgi:hypothetical protein
MNRKTIRKYNKKYKTIRRAIRRTRKGGDVKDFRDKMFTKFGRQSQAKTEFKSLLRRMEKLGFQCNEGMTRVFQARNIYTASVTVSVKDWLKSKIETIRSAGINHDDIVAVLMELGQLYLKYPKEWNFTSDVGNNDKNIKYGCVMELGKFIGNKITQEHSAAKPDMSATDIDILMNKQTRIQKLLDDTKIELETKLRIFSSGEKSKNDPEYIELRNLIVKYTGQISCIDTIITKIRSSGTTDINDISSKLNCVDYRFRKNLEELLQEARNEYYSQLTTDMSPASVLSSVALSSVASVGGSRRRRMNTHRRGKHTRRYNPKK